MASVSRQGPGGPSHTTRWYEKHDQTRTLSNQCTRKKSSTNSLPVDALVKAAGHHSEKVRRRGACRRPCTAGREHVHNEKHRQTYLLKRATRYSISCWARIRAWEESGCWLAIVGMCLTTFAELSTLVSKILYEQQVTAADSGNEIASQGCASQLLGRLSALAPSSTAAE